MIAQRFGFTGDFSRERDSRSIAEREKSPVDSKIKRGRVANGQSGLKPAKDEPIISQSHGSGRSIANHRLYRGHPLTWATVQPACGERTLLILDVTRPHA